MKTRLSDLMLEGGRSRSATRRGRGSRGAAPAGPGLDRWLRGNSGALTFAGITLGVFVSRKFLVLPLAAMAGLCAEGMRNAVQRASETSGS